MHGRLKVKTTAEQQEAKKKEREKKLLLYQAATTKVFAKRSNNEFDQELLNLTGEILSVNSDFSTLWNIRCEIFEAWLTTKTTEELQKAFNNELYFLEQCLQMNPKSYGAWHHRCWTMDKMPDPNWKRELMLCSRFLDMDERNFHCWDYRRFVVRRFGVSAENELEFATSKISSNFSNFSSWHYRSKLLPVVYPDEAQPTGVKEEVLQQEFELVQNAFFTDPSDQSAWFYHKWLLGREQRELSIQHAFADCRQSRILVVLTRHAWLGRDGFLLLTVDGIEVDVQWKSTSGNSGILWIAKLDDSLLKSEKEHSVKILLCGPTENAQQKEALLHIGEKADYCHWMKKSASGTLFSCEFSAATSDSLSQEINSCTQLHELEPDNKWVILTLLSLMRALEPTRYLPQTVSYLDKLVVLDPMRRNYYLDLRSKFLMEDALESGSSETERSFSLTGKQLTVVYHLEHLAGMVYIDLSQNSLIHLQSGHLLQCVKEIKLNDNHLRSCDGIEGLPCLEVLDLRNNDIREVLDLVALQSCPKLQTLQLNGNPVMNIPDCHERIKQFLPSVIHIQ